jgi:hypothetical protein
MKAIILISAGNQRETHLINYAKSKNLEVIAICELREKDYYCDMVLATSIDELKIKENKIAVISDQYDPMFMWEEFSFDCLILNGFPINYLVFKGIAELHNIGDVITDHNLRDNKIRST